MSERWTLGGPRHGDGLRRIGCLLTGHDWETNTNATQRMCPRCWTVDDNPPRADPDPLRVDLTASEGEKVPEGDRGTDGPREAGGR